VLDKQVGQEVEAAGLEIGGIVDGRSGRHEKFDGMAKRPRMRLVKAAVDDARMLGVSVSDRGHATMMSNA
jgi:hypothetical protein